MRGNRDHGQVRGYINRQLEQVEKMNRLEKKLMPEDIVYADIDTCRAKRGRSWTPYGPAP